MQCFKRTFHTCNYQVFNTLTGKSNNIYKYSLPMTILKPQSNRQIFSLVTQWLRSENSTLKNVVSDAERVLGLPTSYLRLPIVLGDELSLIASNIKKLATTKHPLVSAASKILGESKHTMRSRGLLVLLLSKVISASDLKANQLEKNDTFQNQQSLSELTELIYFGFMIHRGIVDRNFLLQHANLDWQTKMELGNKMAVLSGDFLLASACVALAELKNSKVISLMSNAIRDMSKGYFMVPESGPYSQIPSLDNIPCSINEWEDVIYLSHGSLLCNACRASSELVNGGQKYTEHCADFAKHVTLAQQARLDIQRINKKRTEREKADSALSELCALPVSIAANENGGKKWLEKFVITDKRDPKNLVLAKDKLISAVSNCTKSSKRSEEVCSYHREMALVHLHMLPDSEARRTVEHLTNALSAG